MGGRMTVKIPMIIQGGMGAGVSGWRLAQAVSRLGQLGVVAGTALDEILVRRLQDGDPGGVVRHALDHFPFRDMARRIVNKYFVPGGKGAAAKYVNRTKHGIDDSRERNEICVAGNFVEVFLARQGHSNPVGINYLEKIQFPHLPSIYGAILGKVAVVIMGAGIPVSIPAALEALAANRPASYPIWVSGAERGAVYQSHFDPADLIEGTPPALEIPAFLPIVSSVTLANVLIRKTGGRLSGFVIEGPLAGGHNAPPRGAPIRTPDGQPVYGERDIADLSAFRALGHPFWLAGSCGSPEGLRRALAEGASGIQMGTAFALSRESCLMPEIRLRIIRKALAGELRVFTDPIASPTGFPFKVAELEGTLSDPTVYDARRRICDLGFLREAYLREDGRTGYRCAAEPVQAYIAKGGTAEQATGRKCLCNALVANIGMPQTLSDETQEKRLVTLGDDGTQVGRFCTAENPDFSAEDVIRIVLGTDEDRSRSSIPR